MNYRALKNFSPSHAPHLGGLWEATICADMTKVMAELTLSSEQYRNSFQSPASLLQ